MKTIQTSQQAGPDGRLRLEIPVDKVGHTYHVLVILDEQSAESQSAGEWPPGYLDSTIGRWQGDFVYESEGPRTDEADPGNVAAIVQVQSGVELATENVESRFSKGLRSCRLSAHVNGHTIQADRPVAVDAVDKGRRVELSLNEPMVVAKNQQVEVQLKYQVPLNDGADES